MKERLHKLLADRGIASRRQAERLIVAGRVRVNGKLVRDLGTSVDPETDSVLFDDRSLPPRRVPRVLMLNKPLGYLCTSRAGRETGRTIFELVPNDRRYFSVGRLDRDSSGLLLLTDDGQLAHRLSHPRFETRKVYQVEVASPLTTRVVRRLVRGIEIGDGLAQAVAATQTGAVRLRLTLIGGRKRQIRRMLDALGHRVVTLHRTQVGRLRLGKLPVGKWRELSADEVAEALGSPMGDKQPSRIGGQ